MVKLRKIFNYVYKEKTYHKFVISVGKDKIDAVGWKENEELEIVPVVDDGKRYLAIKKKVNK